MVFISKFAFNFSAVACAAHCGLSHFLEPIMFMRRISGFVLGVMFMLCASVSNAGVSERSLRPYFSFPATELDTLGWVVDSVPVVEDISLNADAVPDTMRNVEPSRVYCSIPGAYSSPAVFGHYELLDPLTLAVGDGGRFPEIYEWLNDLSFNELLVNHTRQRYMMANPEDVRYNLAFLPEPPKMYRAYVDPTTTNIVLEEVRVNKDELAKDLNADIDLKKWIHNFDASLQFSQAYISPNWYQGGNNNLNMIGQVAYHVNLNQKLYPNYLVDFTAQYKIGLNSAPDDSIRSYNISEDIFQLNATVGLKAAKRWFYSANVMFKTQLFNSYPTNSRQRKASLLSPGELNVGLGMTYSYANPKKTLVLGLSISPLSWNLKTCIDRQMDETTFGIAEGHKTLNKVGSSAEATLQWKVAYNIVYSSRLFAFTDYGCFQGDWEHTIDFNINKFLTTRLYLHMRYDTTTERAVDSSWHKFQFKEIFSFGFAYHFGV